MRLTPGRLPSWLKQEIPSEAALRQAQGLRSLGLNTVCVSARCPNLGDCFNNSQLTFMILGDTCSRSCRFCAVKKGRAPLPLPDPLEPQRIGRQIKASGIKYAVITSVTRDDLADAGAGQFALTVEAIRGFCPKTKIEVLVPDFSGQESAIKKVVGASPEVFGHNLETVRGLYPALKPGSDYDLSLGLLRTAKKINPGMKIKSALMLGLGESTGDILEALRDLLLAGCDLLVLGQYLSPGSGYFPVQRFLPPEEFTQLRAAALVMGFKGVIAEPLARSSYKAAELSAEECPATSQAIDRLTQGGVACMIL